jgi:glycyl-tRNA synthetase alpha subunit
LKCSHLFNLMDARGVISTTERAALMGRVRSISCRTAASYLEHCLKCSHLFNLMDARGVISTTERAALMGRVRSISCRTAASYLEQIGGATPRREVRG